MHRPTMLVLLCTVLCFGQPDLAAPFTVDLLSSSHPLWDTIVVTTYLSNIGDAATDAHAFDWPLVSVRVDSMPVGSHSMPANYVLNAGLFVVLTDTAIVLRAPFALVTWVDPIGASGEGGGEQVNNVRGVAFDFHPDVQYDTTYVLVYDTVTVHDTTVAVDTVTVHDTVVVHDTVYATESTPKLAIGATRDTGEYSELFRVDGRRIWAGYLREGQLPPMHLAYGSHVLVRGDRRELVKVVAGGDARH